MICKTVCWLGYLLDMLTSCAICHVALSRCRHACPQFHNPSHVILCIYVSLSVLLVLSVSKVNCEPGPPKKSVRVVAGFYSFNPSYDTDIPAPIKTVAPKLKAESKRKNTFHYHYHQEQDYGGQYNYHNIYDDGTKSGNQHRPKHHTGYSKSKHKSKSVKKAQYKSKHKATGGGGKGALTTGYYYHYAPYWPYFSKLFEAYIVLARQLAEYYGHKYNYPANLLYWQIINVMFD